MNQNFDIFVKEHLQEILCQVEKEHALALIRKAHEEARIPASLNLPHHLHVYETQLQDCAISPSFSHNHL